MLPLPGWSPARKRTWLPEVKGVPMAGAISCWRSPLTLMVRPAGERSLASTETVPMSPARTTRVSSVSSGGALAEAAGTGMTMTCPSVVP